MQLKKRPRSLFPASIHGEHQLDEQPGAATDARGLTAPVRFFVDQAISTAVGAVARKQAVRAKLRFTGKNGTALQVVIAGVGEADSYRFVAYTNEICLFVGASPGLYVVNHTARELEHSVYLYISERFAGEAAVSAQIWRETDALFDLPVLEGSSETATRGLRPRRAAVAH